MCGGANLLVKTIRKPERKEKAALITIQLDEAHAADLLRALAESPLGETTLESPVVDCGLSRHVAASVFQGLYGALARNGWTHSPAVEDARHFLDDMGERTRAGTD